MDDSYFTQPIHESTYFRGLTALMALSIGFGLYTTVRFWRLFPSFVKSCLVIALLGVFTIWARGILTQRRFRALLADTKPDTRLKDLVRLSADLHYYGQSKLYAIALILFTAILITVVHLQHLTNTAIPR